MKWRTDKPTADLIVAKLNNGNYSILERLSSGRYCIQDKSIGYDILHGENMVFIYEEEIQKWADLEEDEVVDLPMWKKSDLPNVDKCGAGVNSENLCYNGYYISYKELFQKLPKEDERR